MRASAGTGALLALLALAAAPGLVAATFEVTSLADSGVGSLREAVGLANANPGNDTITFHTSLTGQQINLTSDDPAISAVLGPTGLYVSDPSTLTLEGDAVPGLEITGNRDRRVFAVGPGATLLLRRLTVTAGSAKGFDGGICFQGGAGGGGAGLGGGVFVRTGATLHVDRSTIYSCSAQGGRGGTGFTGAGSGGGGGGGMAGPGAAGTAVGGAGGGANGGVGAQPGGPGGFGGGGGGGDPVPGTPPTFPDPGTPSFGGPGGFGGGGGGAGTQLGFAQTNGGTGGFGGGGGGVPMFGISPSPGAGGFGGAGGQILSVNGGAGAGMGGGIFNNGGSVLLINSTIARNGVFPGDSRAQGIGGGLFSRDGVTTIVGCTFAENRDSGIFVLGDTATGAVLALDNSIASDHTTDLTVQAQAGSSVSVTGSGNVVVNSLGVTLGGTAVDPQLGRLSDNGGHTQTYEPDTGSSAFGAGGSALCAAPYPAGSGGTDQRGIARTFCDSGSFERGIGTLGVESGSGQGALIGGSFAQPLRVRLRDAFGDPWVGETVSFSSPGSGASAGLSAVTATTDATGVAQVSATANGSPGNYVVTATHASGLSASLALTNTSLSVRVVSGDQQTVTPNLPFPLPFAVRVVDQNGQAASGVTVVFSTPSSGAGATLSSTSAVTNSSGTAEVRATANGLGGKFSLTASVATGATASFFLSSESLSLVAVSGDQQVVAPGEPFLPLVVRAIDAQGPLAGAPVQFAFSPGDPIAVTTPNATTDGAGLASTGLAPAQTAGTFLFTAERNGVVVVFSVSVQPSAGSSPPPPPSSSGGDCRLAYEGGSANLLLWAVLCGLLFRVRNSLASSQRQPTLA